mgnify:CR=1 FL=1
MVVVLSVLLNLVTALRRNHGGKPLPLLRPDLEIQNILGRIKRGNKLILTLIQQMNTAHTNEGVIKLVNIDVLCVTSATSKNVLNHMVTALALGPRSTSSADSDRSPSAEGEVTTAVDDAAFA